MTHRPPHFAGDSGRRAGVHAILVDVDHDSGRLIFARASDGDLAATLQWSTLDVRPDQCYGMDLHDAEALRRSSQRRTVRLLGHLPFVGSTVFTRYVEPSAVVIRDPVVLDPPTVQHPPDFVFDLIASGEPVVVRTGGYRPSRLAHYAQRSHSVVFLVSGPELFFAQVLKCHQRRAQLRALEGFDRNACTATDSEIAARFYARAVTEIAAAARSEDVRIGVIDCQRFYHDPVSVAAQALDYWALGFSTAPEGWHDWIERVHAKSGQRYDERARQRNLNESMQEHALEIAQALDLLEELADGELDARSELREWRIG